MELFERKMLLSTLLLALCVGFMDSIPRAYTSNYHGDNFTTMTTVPLLRDLCKGFSGAPEIEYDHPCVEVKIACHGLVETVCRKSHVHCLSAILKKGYAKCEVAVQTMRNITVNGSKLTVLQTSKCECAG